MRKKLLANSLALGWTPMMAVGWVALRVALMASDLAQKWAIVKDSKRCKTRLQIATKKLQSS